MPVDEKNKLLQTIYERLEMNVGMRLAEKMTDQQLDEFEGFIDRNDEAGALRWLETNFPNYKQVVAEELEKLKTEVQTAAPQILASSQAVASQPQQPQMPPQQPSPQSQQAWQQQPQAQPGYTPAPNPMQSPAPQPRVNYPPAGQSPAPAPNFTPGPQAPAPQLGQFGPVPMQPTQPSFSTNPQPQPASGYAPQQQPEQSSQPVQQPFTPPTQQPPAGPGVQNPYQQPSQNDLPSEQPPAGFTPGQ